MKFPAKVENWYVNIQNIHQSLTVFSLIINLLAVQLPVPLQIANFVVDLFRPKAEQALREMKPTATFLVHNHLKYCYESAKKSRL